MPPRSKAPKEDPMAKEPARETLTDDDDGELTEPQLAVLKSKLLEERAKVLANLRTHVSDAINDPDKFADEADQASQQVSQTFLLRLADKERKLLTEIDHALTKFEDGSYGQCEGTGEWIGFRRLELRPWTRYSVEYKQRLEKEKALHEKQ